MRAVTAARDAATRRGGLTVLQAYRFALDPAPAQARVLASHCGAARKAFNEGLAQVKRCLDQRDAERSYGVPDEQLTEVPWTLPALRRWWNQNKDELAPWWRENSKEAYNSGLDALARGLKQWSATRSGKRRGPQIGFPRSSPGAGRGCRAGSRRARSASMTARMWCCRASAGSRRTSPPRRCWTRSSPGRHGSWPPRCPSTGGAGTARSPSRSSATRPPGACGPGPGASGGRRRCSGCGTCSWPPRPTAPRSPGCRRRAAWPARRPGCGRCNAKRGPAGRPGPAHRQAALAAVAAHHGADRARPRPRREHPPRRAAQGHHAPGPAPPGDRGRGPRGGEHDPPQTRRRPRRARAEPGDRRRRTRRAAPPARLQDHLVRLGPVVADRWYPSSKTCSACGAVKAKLALADRLDRVTTAARSSTVTSTPRSTSPA